MCRFSIILILNYNVSKSKSRCFLLKKSKNFNKNERELKMENSIYTFREMILLIQLIHESQIKSKTVMRSISPYSVRMRENADQKNPEYGHFSRSVNVKNIISIKEFYKRLCQNYIKLLLKLLHQLRTFSFSFVKMYIIFEHFRFYQIAQTKQYAMIWQCYIDRLFQGKIYFKTTNLKLLCMSSK